MKQKHIIRRAVVGRRPKSFKADLDTRASILAAARRVFAGRGVDGTSVREVAEAAKVNNAMIYYYFRDKVELYRAVLLDSFAALNSIWDDEIFVKTAPARKKIHAYIEGFIRFQHGNEDLRRILAMELTACGKNIKWIADNYFTNNFAGLAKILRQGMKSGEIKKCNPSMAAASLIGMIIHSFVLKPLSEHVPGMKLELSPTKLGAFVADLFCDGLVNS